AARRVLLTWRHHDGRRVCAPDPEGDDQGESGQEHRDERLFHLFLQGNLRGLSVNETGESTRIAALIGLQFGMPAIGLGGVILLVAVCLGAACGSGAGANKAGAPGSAGGTAGATAVAGAAGAAGTAGAAGAAAGAAGAAGGAGAAGAAGAA